MRSRELRLSPTVTLPLEAVTGTFAFLAVRGAGKSTGAADMAEEMFAAQLPFVVIDPYGAHWGLRAGVNGNPKGGLPIPIFGGKHGDVALDSTAGALIADLIVDKRLSCVLDLSSFKSEADKKRFLLAFATQLFQRNEDPLHLFFEEADDYIPQSPMDQHDKLLIHAFANIVRRGRGRGLGITLLTQRSAAVNKNALSQIETLFAMRTTDPRDIKAISEWVKYHQVDPSLLSSLAGLEDGEAWIWSPKFLKRFDRFRFRMRRTFDSGATPKNVRGRTGRRVATLADIDLSAIEHQMAATIEKTKSEDPRELRKQIAELKKQLSAKPVVVKAEKPQKMPKRIEVKVITEAQIKRFEKLEANIGQRIEALGKLGGAIREAARAVQPAPASDIKTVREWQKAVGPYPAPKQVAAPIVRKWQEAIAKPGPAPKPARATQGAEPDGELPEGERAVLICVAQYPDGATKQQIAIMTGYKMRTVNAYVQRLGLNGRKYVDGKGRTVVATQTGIDALGSAYEPLPVGDALREHWLMPNKLPEGERKVFEVVIAAYPESAGREGIGETTGFMPRTVNAYIQRLKARKLVATQGRGQTVASSELFS